MMRSAMMFGGRANAQPASHEVGGVRVNDAVPPTANKIKEFFITETRQVP